MKHIYLPWHLVMTVHQFTKDSKSAATQKGLSGDDIIEEASIIGLADTLEAMAIDSPYRRSPGI